MKKKNTNFGGSITLEEILKFGANFTNKMTHNNFINWSE